jgi:hypothetical protein
MAGSVTNSRMRFAAPRRRECHSSPAVTVSDRAATLSVQPPGYIELYWDDMLWRIECGRDLPRVQRIVLRLRVLIHMVKSQTMRGFDGVQPAQPAADAVPEAGVHGT